MEVALNTILQGDCVARLRQLQAGSVDLVFADPPFNIGYDYDVYKDELERDQYLQWSQDWIAAVHRVLKPDGTFWLAIGDEYAAELKIQSQQIGFCCRSWVVWYYTFGVNCTKKFTRSHAHLFYFVKDPKNFTFRDDDLDNRIPSARELVYNDRRANPKGRLPDDTWIIRPADVVGEMIADDDMWSPEDAPVPTDDEQTWTLRPQDLAACFKPTEDTWYFPRVAGTFKERAGFHGCQMPEQLLGRIIRACSNEGELVLDPFSGSATTLAVAKKLGRSYLGFDLSKEYVQFGRRRLNDIRVGDRLDGSAEPLKSAPKTRRLQKSGRAKEPQRAGKGDRFHSPVLSHPRSPIEHRYEQSQLELTLRGVLAAFAETHSGFSADRVVADPEMNARFAQACRQSGLVGDVRTWNRLLFRLRKAGELAQLPTTKHTSITWHDCDEYLFASEIALQMMLDKGLANGLDEIFCDPELAAEFDATAQRFAPGFTALEYRWAALKLRKQAKVARTRGAVLKPPSHFGRAIPLDELDENQFPETPGVYLLNGNDLDALYVGETLNLRGRLARITCTDERQIWTNEFGAFGWQSFATEIAPAEMLAWQSCLARRFNPRLNFHELRNGE